MHADHTWEKYEINKYITCKRIRSMMIIENLQSHMRRSAVIWRWNLDSSSFKIAESLSSPLAKSMLPRWRIAATTLKIASWERERERERGIITGFTAFICLTYAANKCFIPQQKQYLLFLTYSNNIHGSLSGEIIMSITYANQFIAIWLIKIVKWFRVSQLVFLFLLIGIRIY